MSVFPVVKGVRLRATRINSCGLPIAGPANRIVTDGFVTVKLNPVLRDAQDLEQTNAEGKVCVADRTSPERKWYTADVDLCNVNTGLISLFNSFPQILDFADKPIGFQDQKDVEHDFGVMIEVWTGGRADDDCPTPELDSIFTAPTSGKKYGYLLFGATEFKLGNIDIGASVSTFTLSGVTIAAPQWGRGPYNVAATDSSGTPGRLLEPVGQEPHMTLFRTPVPPPDITPGAEPVALAISTLFTAPDYYFGGPSNAPAADVAPEQGSNEAFTVSITGTPTGGTFTLKLNGNATGAIAYNANAAAVKTALVAIDDGHTAAEFTTGGGALPGTPVTVATTFDATLVLGTNSLTGGTSPTVVVS